MGFEGLISELHRQADAEAKKLIALAEKASHKAEEEAKSRAEEIVKAAKKEALDYAKQESAERIISAKLSAKKIVDEARDEAVEACLGQVWASFKSESLRKDRYPQLLERLIKDGIRELGTSEVIVYVRDEDRSLVPGYRTAKLPPNYSGGAIIESANGKIRVNKTLEEIFAQRKNELRKAIYSKLF